jgi:polyhydroxyalkanoate synthesis regulator phasin
LAISKRKFVKMEPSEIGKMKLKELRPLLRDMRKEYQKQAAVFEKHQSTAWSPALEKMQDYYEAKPMDTVVSRMKIDNVRNELFRLQDFFQSKTSTLKGSREVMREQDARIFGINPTTGRPNKRMTLSQRIDFWAAYNEFTNIEKSGYVRNMTSGKIQTFLGEMVTEKGRNNLFAFTSSELRELKRRLEEDKLYSDWEQSQYEDFENSVLSGKRPTN